MIDQLLDSPHYGERWARHWLDVAGYADSEGGGNRDEVRPWAYKYRDWVIEAINANQPFDQFTIEQIAGDLLPGSDARQRIGTGFFRNTLTNREAGTDREEARCQADAWKRVDRIFGTLWKEALKAKKNDHTRVVAWAGDTEWLDFTERYVSEGVPVLRELIGEPWPEDVVLARRVGFARTGAQPLVD